MADITWSPEGEKLFGQLCSAIPENMRETVRPKLLELLASRAAGQPVTTDMIREMVEHDIPEPQKGMLMQALGMKTQEQEAEDELPGVQWAGKSEVMFEIMLGEVPEAMRNVFRGKLLGVIADKVQGGPATEETVTAVVNEIVPEPFKSSILSKFKQLGDFDIKVIDEIVARHGTERDRLMFILHDVQDEIGYLPVEALRAVSEKCSIALSTIYNIVTFYKSFRTEKPAAHHIKLCNGTACHLQNNQELEQAIEQKIKKGADISYEKTLCLGCCDCSPAAQIDDTVYKGKDALTKIDSM